MSDPTDTPEERAHKKFVVAIGGAFFAALCLLMIGAWL